MKKTTHLLPRLQLPVFSKRQQFVAVTVILTLVLMATQLISDTLRLDILLVVSGIAYILSAISLREELRGWDFLTLLILPSYFTAAVFVFYFLLPTLWLTRLPIAVLYAVGIYAILLTENIYNVASERTIQLLRAAHSVGFLLTLVTTFFLMDTVLSLRLPFYLNTAISILVLFPLILQALWSMELTQKISGMVLWSSFALTLILVELVALFSFWPIRTTIEALFITTIFYSLVGMTQQFLIGRLFPNTSREFLLVLVIVFFLVVGMTRWGVTL